MDAKVYNQMITDLQVQHELLKTALEATDNYLAIEKQAKEAGLATNSMVHDFTYEMARAHDALQSLGVLDQHEGYMAQHAEDMLKLHGHKEVSITELPYAHIPRADTGEIEESIVIEELDEAVWDQADERKDLPKEKLSPASKAKAKARAKAAGRPYPNMVDNMWAAKMQEDTFKQFIRYVVEQDDEGEISEDEINEIVDNLDWEDIVELYSPEELIEVEDDEQELDEALSAQSRLKKRQAFARFKGKRTTAKGIKLRRASTPQVLQKRAKLAARRALYQRFLKGRDKASLSASEKDRIEKQVASLKNIQSTLAMRMLPKMRSIEQKRLSSFRSAAKK